MVIELDRKKGGGKPAARGIGYGGNPDGPPAAAEDFFGYMASCPMCKRRVFDVSSLSEAPIHVRLKCPHCRNVVRIPISATL